MNKLSRRQKLYALKILVGRLAVAWLLGIFIAMIIMVLCAMDITTNVEVFNRLGTIATAVIFSILTVTGDKSNKMIEILF